MNLTEPYCLRLALPHLVLMVEAFLQVPKNEVSPAFKTWQQVVQQTV